MYKSDKIYVAGHTGLLGSAVVKILTAQGFENIVTRSHSELELMEKLSVESFFRNEKLDYVFLCAGKVGGIMDNKTYPADYMHSNLAIQDNVFEMALKYDVKHIVFYGSSCTYPKLCKQPMKERYWMTGAIEKTSEAYAAAKIAGIIGCRSYNSQYKNNRFICLVPSSIYGPNDNFDLKNSHVFAALIRKFCEAQKNKAENIMLWGTGEPRREFIFSEDVASASIFAIENANRLENNFYNIGTGEDYSIKEISKAIKTLVGYSGNIIWDTSMPDGTPRKLLDSSRFMALGWKPNFSLKAGLEITLKHFEGK